VGFALSVRIPFLGFAIICYRMTSKISFTIFRTQTVPMAGKEIIDKAIAESGGIWKPSPGLIYPFIGQEPQAGANVLQPWILVASLADMVSGLADMMVLAVGILF
jgi:hypothetical protein